MHAEILLFLLVPVLLAILVALVVLFAKQVTEAREREALARRLAALERAAHREDEAAAAPLSPRPSPRSEAAARVLPAEHDYAAAEEELRAEEEAASPAVSTAAPPPAPTRAPIAAPEPRGDAARVPPPRPAGPVPVRAGAPAERRPAALSLEDFLGGRVLLVVGVVVVLFALGFFLKYAIERELIEPPVRVGIGVLSGLVALVGGDVLRRRGFDVFGHAVMGGGLGALFLSTFFAAVRYGLIGRPVAFGVTAAVALVGVLLSIRREAPLLAYLGFLGGYAAPAILGEGRDALEGLTLWLLALHAGVLVVLWLRRWPGLDVLAFASSAVYYLLWADHFLRPERLGAAAWCLGALTTLVLLLSLAPGVLRRRPLMPTALLTAVVTGATAVSAGFELFHEDHRIALGGAILALGVVYALAARRAVGRDAGGTLDAPALDGCAVGAVAAAIPALLEGAAIAPAWSAAGAVAAFVAATRRSPAVLVGAFAMIALAQIDLLDHRTPMHSGPFLPFANGAFLAWASPSIALVLAGLLVRWRSPWRTASGMALGAGAWMYAWVLAFEVAGYFGQNRAVYGAATSMLSLSGALAALAAYALALALIVRSRSSVAILLPLGPLAAASLLAVPALLGNRPSYVPVGNAPFLAGLVLLAAWWTCTWIARGGLRPALLVGSVGAGLFVIGAECAAYGANAPIVGTSREALARVGLVWMSVTFALYAAVLLGLGFARRVPPLRWSGLAIFLVTLGKVFLVDMARLPTAHRIGGFLVLGLLLLGGSFLYQRTRRDDAAEGET